MFAENPRWISHSLEVFQLITVEIASSNTVQPLITFVIIVTLKFKVAPVVASPNYLFCLLIKIFHAFDTKTSQVPDISLILS